MEGFIATGKEWMKPLHEFRAQLITYRDEPGMRSPVRRDGTPGTGPFTSEARKRILRELLETERQAGWQLISDEDLNNIQAIWSIEFDYIHSDALKLAKEFGRKIKATKVISEQPTENILETAAMEADVPYELLQAVLSLTKNKWPSLEIYGAKTGLERDVEQTILLAAKQVEQAAP